MEKITEPWSYKRIIRSNYEHLKHPRIHQKGNARFYQIEIE